MMHVQLPFEIDDLVRLGHGLLHIVLFELRIFLIVVFHTMLKGCQKYELGYLPILAFLNP